MVKDIFDFLAAKSWKNPMTRKINNSPSKNGSRSNLGRDYLLKKYY